MAGAERSAHPLGVQDVIERIGRELLRYDVRRPRLSPEDWFRLDFHAVAWPGDVVLVHRDGVFAVEIAPSDAVVVAVVRVLDST